MKLGPGHKRKAAETTIFKELNQQAYSDSDEEEKHVPKKMTTDLTQRRKYADPPQEEQDVTMAAGNEKMKVQKQQVKP